MSNGCLVWIKWRFLQYFSMFPGLLFIFSKKQFFSDTDSDVCLLLEPQPILIYITAALCEVILFSMDFSRSFLGRKNIGRHQSTMDQILWPEGNVSILSYKSILTWFLTLMFVIFEHQIPRKSLKSSFYQFKSSKMPQKTQITFFYIDQIETSSFHYNNVLITLKKPTDLHDFLQ